MAEAFLCIGAMKSGTTSIYELLRRHPDVDVVAEKEASELLDPCTASDLAQRVARSRARIAGEVTAAYMQSPLMEQPVEEAIKLLGSRVRVIAILRDPFTRAISHWEHWSHLGKEHRPLSEALLAPDSPYIAFSSYGHQLGPWRQAIPEHQIHLIKLDEYQADPAAVSRALWTFLGVTPQGDRDAQPVHVNAGDQRVVAVGLGKRLSSLTMYRRMVRPLVPAAARRVVATALGGARGRMTAIAREDLREQFMDHIRDDQELLARGWPDRTWW